MKKLNTIALIATASVVIPNAAFSGNLHDELEGTFNALVNETDPQSFSTQSRGGFTAGRVTAKFPIVNTSIVQATMPSFKAGCGGVDMYGGSFSHINKEQFVELARAIVSNATGFMFHQALAAMPIIDNTLKHMQKAVDFMNGINLNSCELAEGIVTTKPSEYGKKFENFAQSWNTAIGASEDASDAKTPPDNKTPSQYMAEVDPDKYLEKGGNVIWDQMKKNNLHTMLPNGNDAFLQDILSLTGAVILTPTDESGQSKETPEPDIYPGVMTLEQAVFGGSVSSYACDETTKCLKVTKTNGDRSGGLYDRLRKELIDGTDSGPSILEIINNPAATLSDQQKQFIAGLSQDTGTFMMRLARMNPKVAKHFMERTARTLATEMAFDAANQMLTVVRSAVAASDKVAKEKALEMLSKEQEELRSEYVNMQQKYGTLENTAQLYKTLLVAVDQRSLNHRSRAEPVAD